MKEIISFFIPSLNKVVRSCLWAWIFGIFIHDCAAADTVADDAQRPHEHLCPITQEVMTDPVMAADGHSYERSAIVEYFSRNNSPNSPMTGLPLANTTVTSNQALRVLINDWRPGNAVARLPRLEEGDYIISNKYIPGGRLTYANAKTYSGYHVQALDDTNSRYQGDKTHYEAGGKWSNTVLWHISPAENGYYTIKNKAIPTDGRLTYVDNSYLNGCQPSNSGNYIQVLSPAESYFSSFLSYYESERAHYEVGGKYRNAVLWYITLAENGYYILKNRAVPGGKLTYTEKASNSGYYVQALSDASTYYQGDRGHYEEGGKWRDTVLWQLTRQNPQ